MEDGDLVEAGGDKRERPPLRRPLWHYQALLKLLIRALV